MNQLININSNMTMSSLDIVKTINAIRKLEGNNTELRHSDFLEKVKQVLPHSTEFSAQYNDSTGRLLPCYNFPKRECMLMAMSYSYTVQAAVYDAWQELENQQVSQLPNFANPAEAAIAWAHQYTLAQEAIKTKAEIGSRREATSMATASVATKKANRLEVELDKAKDYATVKRVEMATGQKYKWKALKDYSLANNLDMPKVFDANYESVRSYHADAWFECYSIDILELK